mgnify:CR=1 FL=1
MTREHLIALISEFNILRQQLIDLSNDEEINKIEILNIKLDIEDVLNKILNN